MTRRDRQVAVIGSGVAGLAAAEALARRGVSVVVFEKAAAAGGHAARLSCKATDRCVACGACVAQELLRCAGTRDNVTILTSTQIQLIERNSHLTIHYRNQGQSGTLQVEALLVSSGFAPCDPSEKPYGYGQFGNVLTQLEAEHILREYGLMVRPSDKRPPERMAFIQCVGSRDARSGHPWCSKICCASALRTAALIQHRQPRVDITFFYIDVQTFGRNFKQVYDHSREQVTMVRAIPGDIFKMDDDRLQVIFFDPRSHQSTEAEFDMVILSVGLTPAPDNAKLAQMLGWPLTALGFFEPHNHGQHCPVPGVFIAGTAQGPMSIAESIDSAGQAARDMLGYLADDGPGVKP